MIKRLLIAFFLVVSLSSSGQDPNEDYSWWNQLHGWEEGMPGWRNWIIISPGYLGPNALPVPEVKKGLIGPEAEIEITASGHFLKGDPTQDISGRLFLPFAGEKIAVEVYGVVLEHFSFSEEIRDERFARIRDGKGLAFGDLYFSTQIQLAHNRKFPNTLLRMTAKTASGNKLEGARYTDSPGYFFDLSFSKDFNTSGAAMFRPFAMVGFYSWQTNDEENLQNDAFLYALGTDFIKDSWTYSGSLAGYSGYKEQRDRPMQINLELRKDWNSKALRLQFLNGVRDWKYKTVKFSFIWKLNPIR